MKSKLLVATTAAALAAGTYYAVAQGVKDGGSSAGAGASGSMSQSPSPGSAGGAMKDGAQGSGGLKAQGGADVKSDRAQGERSGASTSGQAPSSAQSPSGSQSNSPSQRSGTNGATSPTQRSGSDTQRSGSDTQRSPNAAQSDSKSPSGSSAQSGAAGTQGNASASLTTQQRTEIKQTVIKQSNAPRVSNVNFSLSVGTVVPRTVKYVTVPETIVRIHPAWRGYSYFIVDEQIVIIEPSTLRIVAVL